ncbi:MAG: 50S ribosomal protein L10 [Candidatus Doudnabacteria bacterium]|nr:50S ribosomal protein L10 [Candidatus Doudnabacteria bacterium]
MSKGKSQKADDLKELTAKLKEAKSVVFTGYRGTTVKDLDRFRKTLRTENVFSKVYKLTLLKKAIKDAGLNGEIADYKTPVIMAISAEDEVSPARVIKTLTKDLKTISILEGFFEGKLFSKAQVEALGDLPSKDQLRSQFMSVLNGPAAAFARLLDAYAKKKGEAVPVSAPVAA